MKTKLLLTAFVSSFILHTSAFAQGALTPPGAPAPTMKSLAQIEPRTDIVTLPIGGFGAYTITQPGSYFLSANIVGAPGVSGIEIKTNDVSIDLHGFSLIGAGGLYGIYATAGSFQRITVRNGGVTGYGSGIECSAGHSLTVEDVQLVGFGSAGGRGITGGDRLQVRRCQIRGFTGIAGAALNAGNQAQLADCLAQTNYNGISVSANSEIADCKSIADGAYAFSAGYNSHLAHCLADQNSGVGISGGSYATFIGCSASNNGSNGIVAGQYSLVRDCAATGNQGRGIDAGINTLVSDCTAAYNTAAGIVVNSGSTVSDCLADYNSGDGIVATNDCRVTGNNCNLNGFDGVSYGIHITGNFTRVEGNHAVDNTSFHNLKLNLGTTNLVIRNTVNGATAISFNIPVGTLAGPLLTNAAAVLTNSNPNANFAY